MDGSETVESIWSYVGSCIFSTIILAVLLANFDRVKELEGLVERFDSVDE